METAVTESLPLPPKPGMSHEKRITLALNQGTEIKVTMTKAVKFTTFGGPMVEQLFLISMEIQKN